MSVHSARISKHDIPCGRNSEQQKAPRPVRAEGLIACPLLGGLNYTDLVTVEVELGLGRELIGVGTVQVSVCSL